MGKPNFFCGIEGLQWLLQNEPKSTMDDIDLTVDLIEAPYLFIYTSDADAWNLKVMGRGEIYDHEKGSGIERGNIRMDKKTGQGTGQTSDPLLRDNMGAFFEACRRLSRYIRDENLQPLYAGLDPEQAGVMLEVSGGKLTARKVAGKERPEIMCTTLFGGPTMCRPYMEDFWDRSETDMMSLEEKIEKAEGGDKFAMAKLAQAYLDGDDEVEQDPAKAAYWFRKEAELEDSEGAFNLGLLYAKGFGVERDFEKAAEWMEKAVAWGDPDGKGPAALYRSMAENQQKAEAGDAAAMAALAEGYMGLGGSLDQAGSGEDYKLCLQWAQKAVDAGCAAGYWPLALAYEHGRGVEQDDAKAVEFYRKGAEGGNAPCQHSYGCRLMQGQGVGKDKRQAFELFTQCAEQGYGLAMRDLGRCYQFAEGCMGNMKTAVEWYEKALQVIDDPDLARKAAFFRQIGENNPDWDLDYPPADDDFEVYDPEEAQRQRAEEWQQKYAQYAEKDPHIVINGSKFVFTGILVDDWESVLEKLTAMGGVERGAVSGKTDYLVVDPRGFGESKVKAALEQRTKGKPVKIVLVDDFLKALGWNA
jgi:TPR repeat protein